MKYVSKYLLYSSFQIDHQIQDPVRVHTKINELLDANKNYMTLNNGFNSRFKHAILEHICEEFCIWGLRIDFFHFVPMEFT